MNGCLIKASQGQLRCINVIVHPIKNIPPRFTIALVSAIALAYEILLMRLMSIIQYHHFAYMIISLALLGYGASGTVLFFTREKVLQHFEKIFPVLVMLFSITLLGCFLIAQRLPLNPEEIFWNMSQSFVLMFFYLLLAVPFFFAALVIATAFARFPKNISSIYSFDLIGAGFGSLAVIGLLFFVFPEDALKVLAALGFFAVGVAWLELRLQPYKMILFLVLAAGVPFILPNPFIELNIMPYKGLRQQLRISGTEITKEYSSPLGYLSVVKSTEIPFRHAPGLSLNADSEPPEQLGVFIDGGSMTPFTKANSNLDEMNYLDQVTSALPYHLARPEQVLILGAGGGTDVLQARFHNAVAIDAVELNPQIIRLVQNDFREFVGSLLNDDTVQWHIAEARGFVSSTNRLYDLIQLSLIDSFGASAAGVYALNENYLYTVEAVTELINHLKPQGYLAISRWIKLPPRDTFKIFATAIDALKQSGVADPAQQLVLIRGWQTSTLLLKNGLITEHEVVEIKKFCEERSFDVAYYPGMKANEANQYNILQEPYFFNAAVSLLSSEKDQFHDRYKFNVKPASDDKPYFFHFFKWQALPEIIALRGRGGTALIESGYLILVATLIQAVLASIALIVLPLFIGQSKKTFGLYHFKETAQVFIYFSSIGLAFLFMEIALIQKFILFLSHPLYALAVVITAFLVFAGLGSRYSPKVGSMAERFSITKPLVLPVVGIVMFAAHYLVLLGPTFSLLMAWPDAAKIIVSILLIAPLAFCMGMPFPLGMSKVGEKMETLIPWAWAINGCASVISAVLATILAIHFGFSVVVVLAIILYCLASWVYPESV